MASLTIKDRVISICNQNLSSGVTQDALLKSIEGVSADDLLNALNDLLREGRIRIFQSSSSPDPIYKMVTMEEYEKLKGLAPEFVLVYRLIEGAQREGAWVKTLKQQSKMQTTQLQKALKVLEQKQLIKVFKSVLAKNKRYYILYNLQPAVEHQGGVGYGPDLEFDRDFVDALNEQCFQYVVRKGYASLEEIRQFIKTSNISHVDLSSDDVQKLVDTLVYDGKLEPLRNPNAGAMNTKKPSAAILYRSSRIQLPLNGIALTPCGRCPVFDLCSDQGDITPATCVYMKEWLEY